MSDPNNQLKIDINVTKSGDGAAQTAAELRQTADAAGDAHGATKKLTEAQDEHSKSTEHQHEHIAGLNTLFRQLGRVTIPELGHSLHGLELGGAGYLVVLISLIEVLHKFKEAQDELVKKNSEAVEGFAETTAAIRESLQAASDYNTHLAQIAKNENEVAEALKSQIELRHALAEAEGKTGKANQSAAEAKIESDLAAKRITEPQAAARKALLGLSGQSSEDDRSHAEAVAHAQDLAGQFFHAQIMEPRLRADRDSAIGAEEAEKRSKAAAPGIIKTLQEQLPEIKKELDARETGLQNVPTVGDPKLLEENRESLREMIQESLDKYNHVLSQIQHQQDIINAPSTAGKSAEHAKELYDKNAEALKALPAQIDTADKLAGINAGGNAGSEAGISRSTLLRLMAGHRDEDLGGISMGALGDVAGIQEKVRAHQQLTALEKQELQAFTQFYNQHKATHDATFQFLNRFLGDFANAQTQIVDLNRRLDELARKRGQGQ